jgi:hypothetical protein
MAYCGLCGGLLPEGDYKFCGHCGQPITQGTMQIHPVPPTVPALSLPSTQISIPGQEREQAYKSLCQQYESESATAVIVCVEDKRVGNFVYITLEDTWTRHIQSEGDSGPIPYSSRVRIIEQSVGSQTVPVAIFKFDKFSSFSLGDYMIWIDKSTFLGRFIGFRNKLIEHISVTDKRVIFVDLRS